MAKFRENQMFTKPIEMNLAATAAWFPRLFDHKVCHEGYPGHHTDYVLKDQHLARRGYTEQTMYLTLVPQCVISEGIAMVAHEMIFSELKFRLKGSERQSELAKDCRKA